MLRVVGLVLAAAGAIIAADYPVPIEGDWTAPEFRFHDGSGMSHLKLHYTTIGSATNPAVLILHGTGGTGGQFLSPNFAPMLFGPGQLLDAQKYFIILPDGIGHGKSSKPSDGMHARFPKYCYQDMVRAHYRLITEGLSIKHLRLVMGTSMGGMQSWMWGEMYPGFMDALMPLASVPAEIGGRNRMIRRMIIDSIKNDPDYMDGEYTKPLRGMFGAQFALWMMTGSPLQLQKNAPTREAADKLFDQTFYEKPRRMDPNDAVYQFDASRDYDPSGQLESIRAPVLAVNSADDQVNPPELGIVEREIKRVPRGRFVLLPVTDQTRGHGTHTLPAIWGRYLGELLEWSDVTESSAPKPIQVQ